MEQKHEQGGDASKDVFDLERLGRLVELMESHQLTEVDLQTGDHKINCVGDPKRSTLLRSGTVYAGLQPPRWQRHCWEAPAAGAVDGPNIVTIKAPMVGTFYKPSESQAEPFVKVGQRISADTLSASSKR